MRLLPRSLFGRLVLILVSGMLAAQALTSSIWYDRRHGQVLEIPARLIATRLADVVRLVHSDPQQADLLIKLLDAPNFRLTLSDQASNTPSTLTDSDRPTERLIKKVLSEKTGYAQTLILLHLSLVDGGGGADDVEAVEAAAAAELGVVWSATVAAGGDEDVRWADEGSSPVIVEADARQARVISTSMLL